jgi:hypothetical protein
MLLRSTASTSSCAYVRFGSGWWPPKSGLGTQFWIESSERPSSSTKIARPYGPVTPFRASKRTVGLGVVWWSQFLIIPKSKISLRSET